MLHNVNVVRAGNVGRWGIRVLGQVLWPLAAAMSTLEWFARVANQRRALGELDDRRLQDIGLTRADALREAERLFWDVPSRAAIEGGQDTRGSHTTRQHGSRGGSGPRLPSAAVPNG